MKPANFLRSAMTLAASFVSLSIAQPSLAASPPAIAYGMVQNMDEEGAPEGFMFVDVQIYDEYYVRKVQVPYASVVPGYIVKIEMPGAGKKARFVEVAAEVGKWSDSCNWVDGERMLNKGGVVCNGWSYKSLKAK